MATLVLHQVRFRFATLSLTTWVVIGITGLALTLRLWGIGAEPFNRDEVEELWGALHPWKDIVNWSGNGTPTSLYLERLWMTVSPMSEAWLRLLPVLANIGGVLVGFVLGRRLFGLTGGVVVGGLLAVSPTQVYYAREVNEYGWLALMSGLILLAAERVHEKPLDRDRWALLGLAMAAALWVHVGTAFASVAAALTLLPTLRQRALWAGAGLGGVIGLVGGYILWTSLMAEKFANVGTYVHSFTGIGHLLDVAVYSVVIGGSGSFLMTGLMLGLVGTAAYLIASGRVPLSPERKRAIVYAAIPWLLFIVASQYGFYSFAGRYSLAIGLSSALLVALCFTALRLHFIAVIPLLLTLATLEGMEPAQAQWQAGMQSQMADFSAQVQPGHCILSRVEQPIFRSMMRWYTGPDVPQANIADTSLDGMMGQCEAVWVFASVFWDNEGFSQNAQQTYTLVRTVPAEKALWNAQMTLAYQFTR